VRLSSLTVRPEGLTYLLFLETPNLSLALNPRPTLNLHLTLTLDELLGGCGQHPLARGPPQGETCRKSDSRCNPGADFRTWKRSPGGGTRKQAEEQDMVSV